MNRVLELGWQYLSEKWPAQQTENNQNILPTLTWNIHQNRPHPRSKIHLNKFTRLEIIQSLLSDYNRIKLEINSRKIARKSSNTWRQNNIFLRNTKVTEKVSVKLKKKILTKSERKHNLSKFQECSESSFMSSSQMSSNLFSAIPVVVNPSWAETEVFKICLVI